MIGGSAAHQAGQALGPRPASSDALIAVIIIAASILKQPVRRARRGVAFGLRAFIYWTAAATRPEFQTPASSLRNSRDAVVFVEDQNIQLANYP